MSTSSFNSAEARICVNADLVKAALPFAAKEDVRYYLNGVCIQPADEGGALILASDGHMAVCIRDTDGRADKACIVALNHADARVLKREHQLCVGDDNRPWVCNANHVPTWISPRLEVEGKFPNLAGLVGDLSNWQEGLVGTFNPLLIDRIRKAARGKYTQVRFFHQTDNAHQRSALFTFGPTGFGLLMPMRAETDDPRATLATAVPALFSKAA